MKRQYRRVEVKAFGRRLFLKAGGAVALASVLPACSAPGSEPSEDTTSPVDTGPAQPDGGGEDVPRAADVPDRADVPRGTDTLEEPPCEDWAPDPLDGGADALPFESVEPVGGWAEEIPPLSDNASFYVTNYFGVANVDPCAWQLSLTVRGEPLASLDLATVYALEHQEREHTLQCIESQPVLMRMDNAVWTGRPLHELLSELDITLDPALTGIRLLCADGYEVGLPVSELDAPVWLVWQMNGQPLPPEHGFPVRALCPGRFGWQNAKQLVGIDFIEGDPVPAYQQVWDTHYGLQSLVAHPESLSLSPEGESVRLLGKAFGGLDPVVWVGVSVDGGDTFEAAELTYAPGADRWTLWRFVWTPPAPGNYVIHCAARTASGVETTAEPGMDIPYFGGMSIFIEVA